MPAYELYLVFEGVDLDADETSEALSALHDHAEAWSSRGSRARVLPTVSATDRTTAASWFVSQVEALVPSARLVADLTGTSEHRELLAERPPKPS